MSDDVHNPYIAGDFDYGRPHTGDPDTCGWSDSRDPCDECLARRAWEEGRASALKDAVDPKEVRVVLYLNGETVTHARLSDLIRDGAQAPGPHPPLTRGHHVWLDISTDAGADHQHPGTTLRVEPPA